MEASSGEDFAKFFLENVVGLLEAVNATNNFNPGASKFVRNVILDLHDDLARAVLFVKLSVEKCTRDVKVGHFHVG